MQVKNIHLMKTIQVFQYMCKSNTWSLSDCVFSSYE